MGGRKHAARWRCRECGSTRIQLLVSAYVEGMADHEQEHLAVTRYDSVEDTGEVLHYWCLNCKSEKPPRREAAHEEVVLGGRG